MSRALKVMVEIAAVVIVLAGGGWGGLQYYGHVPWSASGKTMGMTVL